MNPNKTLIIQPWLSIYVLNIYIKISYLILSHFCVFLVYHFSLVLSTYFYRAFSVVLFNLRKYGNLVVCHDNV
jgi:hypothetical protein